MLTARDLRFAYPTGDFSLRVPEFHVGKGETVGVGGPSGTGKTTLMRLLAGILTPDGGSLAVCGENASSFSKNQMRHLRLRRLGLVFQDFALLDYLSVQDNILLPSRLDGGLTDVIRKHARELAEKLEIGHHWTHLTSRLSQGERQRVAVARALAHAPGAVLADEPTSSLDERRKTLVIDLLTQYAKEMKASLVVVTHDAAVSGRLDRVVNITDWGVS